MTTTAGTSGLAGSAMSLFARQTARNIRYVQVVPPGTSDGQVGEVYRLAREASLLAPPVMMLSTSPSILAATWTMWAETALVRGVERTDKERVALAVSRGNECPFCVDVHSMALRGDLGSGAPLSRATELEAWVGALARGDRAGLDRRPFSAEEAPELIGTALFFHSLNRLVNVFLDEYLVPLPAPLRGLRGLLARVGGATVGRTMLSRGTAPGQTLRLLPPAPPLPGLAWAEPRPAVGEAFSRAAAAIEEAGERSLPPAVRQLVAEHLERWTGEPMPMSRRWVERAVAGLAPDEQPAGRLALLTALASHQVEEGVVQAFRAGRPDDASLVEATAWAAMAATRRINSFLTAG